MGQKDKAEKLFVACPDVFSELYNVLLYDGMHVLSEDTLIPGPTESIYATTNEELHNQFQDYSMYQIKDDVIRALYTLENQSIPDKRMPLRSAGYKGVSYRNQYHNKKEQGIYPVINIVLNWGEKPWNTPTSIKELLDYPIPKGAETYFENSSTIVFNMRYLAQNIREKFQGDVRIILDYLCDRKSLFARAQQIRNPKEVILMLKTVSGDDKYLEMINYVKEEGGQTMCDLLDEYWNGGVSQGVSQGIRNLMKTMKFTMEQAMDALLIPDEERELYANIIGAESK